MPFDNGYQHCLDCITSQQSSVLFQSPFSNHQIRRAGQFSFDLAHADILGEALQPRLGSLQNCHGKGLSGTDSDLDPGPYWKTQYCRGPTCRSYFLQLKYQKKTEDANAIQS